MAEEDLKSLLETMRQENVAAHAETRRHVETSYEALRQEIRLVVKALTQVNEKLERTATALDEKIDRTATETQALFRFSHGELDRRIRTLEET